MASRREREEAWIKAERNGYARIQNARGEKRPLLHLLSDALAAAHRREDAIRKMCDAAECLPLSLDRYVDADEVLAIIDGDEGKQ